MAQIHQGRIIIGSVTDPRGRNRKNRPLLIVSSCEGLGSTGEVTCVAVTSSFDEPLDWDEVLLPWSPNGRAATQLRIKSVAKCSWILKLAITDVIASKGIVPPAELSAVLSVIECLEDAPEP